MHNQRHNYLCHRDTNNQGIKSDDIDLVIAEYSGFGTKEVNNADGFGESRQIVFSCRSMVIHLTDAYICLHAASSQRPATQSTRCYLQVVCKATQNLTYRKDLMSQSNPLGTDPKFTAAASGICQLTKKPDVTAYLTHWARDEIDNISQTTFSNVFSSMKIFEFRLKFHWSLFQYGNKVHAHTYY